jgi:hypothetical protein
MNMIQCECGESDPKKMMNKGQGRICLTLCKNCHNKQTIERGKRNKQSYLDYKGGKCEKCGYNLCTEAMEFHHKNPSEKDPTFKSMRYWGLEKAKIELDKCLLLCCRCHREKHAGIW